MLAIAAGGTDVIWGRIFPSTPEIKSFLNGKSPLERHNYSSTILLNVVPRVGLHNVTHMPTHSDAMIYDGLKG